MRGDALGPGSRARRNLVVRSLLRWYTRNGRDLPWRRTNDPYIILLSEVMLQQTQVDRVLKKLPLFRSLFPTLASLARASRGDVIRAWSGLGYNGRAIRLHRLAQIVRLHHGGRLPRAVDQLQELPGIGRYTASAIAAFAHDQAVAVVDTNVQRVLRRVFPRESRTKDIWTVAHMVLPLRSSYAWNQGLMDLGATLCTARAPECSRCPLEIHCPSAHRRVQKPTPRRREPSRDGVPDRIYRGRIVQALRKLEGARSTDFKRLGQLVKQPFLARDQTWLRQLIGRLERDRLVRLKKKNGTLFVSLPQ